MENLSEIIMWGLNGVFLLVILLAFLGGLIKGFYKSLTFLGFSIFFFIAGIIAIPFITEWLINFDLSRLNEFLPDEFHITTLKESLPAILTEQFPDFASMFVEGTETMALVFGIVRMAINLVFFIVLIILNATIFKLIPFIVWLIVRPKKNPLTRKRPSKKRLLGGLIGAVKGFGAIMLLAIPLAGVSSLAESAQMALSEGPSAENHSMALVDDEILELIDAVTSYKKSVFGFTLGIPVGDGVRFDESLFDKLLEIRVKTETSDQKLHIRKDIKKAATIFSVVNEANEYKDEIDPLLVLNLTEVHFDIIQKELKGIAILNIAKNIGAEFGYEFIIEEGLDADYEDIVNLQSLKDIDITQELNTLIDIVRILNSEDIKDYITQNGLPEDDEQIADLLGMVTKEQVQSVFDKLVELDLLKVGLPVGVNFALGMDDVKDMLAEIEFEEESIIKPTQEHLLGLVKGAGYLASVILDANEGSLDFDPSLAFNLTDVYIDELQEIITDMTILDLIKEMAVDYGYKLMVKEGLNEGYEDELSLENLQELLLTQELNTILEILRLVNNSELRDEVLENGFPETDEQIEALLSKLDKDLIYEFADILTSLDLIKMGLPVGVNFALRMEEVNNMLAEFEVTTNSITRPTQQVLVDSVKNVIYLAGIVLEVNEGSINFDEKIVNKFTEQDIEDIQDIILDMELLEVVKDVAVEVGYNYLVKEELTDGYENLLTLENLQEIMLTEEIVTILDVVKILINTDIVDYISLNGFPENEEDIDALLALIEKQNIQDIADVLVELELLEYGLPAGLNFALKMDEVDELLAEYEIEADTVRADEQVLVDTVKSAMYLFSVVFDVNDNSLKFDEKIIGKVKEDDITEIQTIISDMEILEVVKEVGVEFGYNYLVKEELRDGYENLLTLENLQEIMLVDEINTILDIVKVLVDTDLQEYIALNGFPETEQDIDELLLLVEKQSLQDIADKLVELKLLEYGLPAGVNFALRMEEVNKLLSDFEIDPQTMDRPKQKDLVDVVKEAIYLFSVVFEANDNSIKFDEKIIGKITVPELEEVKTIISRIELLEYVKDLGAEVGYNFLVKEELREGYEDTLTLENIQKILLKEELATLIDIVIVLKGTDAVDEIMDNGLPKDNAGYEALLAKLDKQNYQDIADELEKLKLLEYGLPAGLNFALKMDEVDKILTDFEVDLDEVDRPTQQALISTVKEGIYLFSIVFEANEHSLKFDDKVVGKLEVADLEDIQEVVSRLEILDFVRDIGAQVGYNYITKEELDEGYETILIEDNIKEIALRDDLVKLFDILILLKKETDLLDDIANNGLPKDNAGYEELLAKLTKQHYQDIADILADLELLEYGLPAGLNFALKMDAVDKILTDFEVDLDEVDRPTQQALISTVKEGIYLFSIVFEANEHSLKFDEKVVGKLEVADLEDIQEVVSRLEILDFVRDIGAQVGYNYITKEELDEGYETILIEDNIKEIALRDDLVKLFDILILLKKETDLLDDIANNGLPKDNAGYEDLLAKLTKQHYQDIADILADLELLEYGLPAGLNFALKMDAVKKILNDYEVDTKTVDRPDQTVLLSTVKEGIYLFSIVFEANEHSLKFDEKLIGKITVPELEEVKDVVLRLEILEFVKELGAEVGYNFLVKEDLREGYEDLLTVDNINAISLKEDIATLIDVIIVLKGTDAVDEIMDNGLPKNNAGYEALLAKLTKQDIQDIADELAELQLLELGLPAGLNFALKMKEVDKILIDFEVDKENLNRPDELVLVDGFKDTLYLFSIVITANEGSLNMNEKLIGKLEVADLEEMKVIIAGMELLEFFKEIGAEVGYNYISKQNLNEGYEDILTVDNFNTILLKDELAILLDIVILLKSTAVVDEIMDNGLPKNNAGYEALVGKLDKDEQQLLIDHIVDLKTLYFGLPAGYNFALNMKETKKLITDFGINQSTLRRPNQDELIDGVKGFGYIGTVLLEANEGKFNITLDILKKISEEQITEIQTEIAQIELLEIIKEVGAEFAHGFLTKEDLLTDYEDELSIDNLNNIQLRDELIVILEALKVYITVDPNEDPIKNPLVFTKQQVDDMITILADLELVQLGYLVGVNFGLKNKEVKKVFTDADVDINNFVKPTKAQAKDDFLNLSVLYAVIKDMNFNHINDFNKVNEEFVKAILDDDVERLVHALFDLSIIYENDELLGEVSFSFADKNLPANYKGILKRDTLVDNFNAVELTHVALLGKLLFEEGLLKDGANIKISEILTDPNIDKITDNVSESIILSEVMGDLINVLTKDIPGGLTIEIPDAVTFYGAPGKAELDALLRSVKNLDEFGLLEAGFDFGSLTHEQMDEISTNFSNSHIIRHNLSPMINQMTSTTEFNFITSDEDESFWTKAEIYNTLNAVKIFKENDINADNIHTLPKNDVRTISYSITVANAMETYLIKENQPGGSIEDKLVIPDGLTYYSVEGGQDGEMVYLFAGLQEILGDGGLDSFNVEVSTLLDTDFDTMFESKIIEATLVEKHLKTMSTEGNFSLYIVGSYENGDEFDWYIGENPNNPEGDSLPFIRSIKVLEDYGISYNTMDFDSLSDVIKNDPGCEQCINDALISSKILNASLPTMFHQMLNEEAELDVIVKPDYNKGDLAYWGEIGTNRELYDVLMGINAAEELADYDYDTLDNSNKDEFKDNAKLIAKSDTLRQLLPRVIDDSGLTMLDSVRSDKDANELTEQEWNDEIDVLVDIIVILNENPGFDIDDPDPINDMPILLALYGLMGNSLLYDEAKLGI